MNESAIRVLLIDDEEDEYILVRDLLADTPQGAYQVRWVDDYDKAAERLRGGGFDVALIDYVLGEERTGLDLMREALDNGCEEPLIILTGKGDEAIDRQAMGAGAADYVDKDEIGQSHSVLQWSDEPHRGLMVRGHVATPLLARVLRHAVERARAQVALRESERRFRDIAEAMSDWIWETDADGVYTLCAGAVREILGYEPEEMVGQSFFDLLDPGDIGRMRVFWNLVKTERRPIRDLELWRATRDQGRVCLRTSAAPIIDRAGYVIGYRGVDRDITYYKQLENDTNGHE